MALFDAFTGAPAKKAAAQNQAWLQGLLDRTGGGLTAGMERGIGELRSGLSQGQDILYPGLERARTDITGGVGGAQDLLSQFGGQAIGQIGGGFDQARGDLASGYRTAYGDVRSLLGGGANAIDLGRAGGLASLAGGLGGAASAYERGIAPLGAAAGQAGDAASLYLDALGMRGPEGVSRAQGAFTTSPGYNFALDQGLEAINRSRNISGQLAGGNTSRQAQQFGQGLAQQEYSNFLNRLQPYAGLQSQLLGQQGQLLSGLGGIYSGTGQFGANFLGGQGQALANLYGGFAPQLSGLGTGLGTQLSGLSTGATKGISDILTGIGQQAAGYQYGGGQNLSNLTQALTQFGAQMPMSTAQQIANLIQGTGGQQVGLASAIAKPYTEQATDAAKAQIAGSGSMWNAIGNIAKAGTGFFGGGGFGDLTGALKGAAGTFG